MNKCPEWYLCGICKRYITEPDILGLDEKEAHEHIKANLGLCVLCYSKVKAVADKLFKEKYGPKSIEGRGVYVLSKGDGEYKIGVSNSVYKRKSDIQKQSPHELALIFFQTVPDALSVERGLHRKYLHANIRGEWFRLSEGEIKEVVEFIKQSK